MRPPPIACLVALFIGSIALGSPARAHDPATHERILVTGEPLSDGSTPYHVLHARTQLASPVDGEFAIYDVGSTLAFRSGPGHSVSITSANSSSAEISYYGGVYDTVKLVEFGDYETEPYYSQVLDETGYWGRDFVRNGHLLLQPEDVGIRNAEAASTLFDRTFPSDENAIGSKHRHVYTVQ